MAGNLRTFHGRVDLALAAYNAGAGAVHRFLAKRGRRVPTVLAVVLVGGAAMAMSDVPLKLLGISDPAAWAAKDWASDAIPHLLYGAVTYSVLRTGEA